MEFNWDNVPFEWDRSLTPRDVEESFEDPFSIRLLPDSPRFSVQARFFNLGKTAAGQGVFSVYRTNGKQIRVIFARAFDEEEQFFYQRKLNQKLS
ncbi:MAG: BrnT family toxin [Limisphaerales bacterium]